MIHQDMDTQAGTDLRHRAEAVVRQKGPPLPTNPEMLSPAEIRQLLHDLDVHRIELEMQNEDLRQAQVELSAARERYFDLYDLAPVGYCTLSKTGLVLEGNLTAALLLGLNRGDLTQRPFSRFIAAADQDVYYHCWQALWKEKTPQTCELRMVKRGLQLHPESDPDQNLIWVCLEATLYQNPDGTEVCRCVLINISDRVRAEQELRHSEDRFRLMFMNAPMPYQSLDEQGNFLDVNQAFTQALGYTREELIGKNFADVLHPDWADHFRENFPRFKAVGEILGVEFDMLKKDGTRILVFFNGKIQHDDQGRFLRTHCIFQDITAQRQVEAERQITHERYLALFDNLNCGVAVYQPVNNGQDFVFVDFNRAAERISRTSKADVMGKHLLEAFPKMEESGLLAALREVYHSGRELDVPEFYYQDAQRAGWRKNFIYPLPSGEIVALYEDITARKEAEQELRQSNRLLEGLINGISDVISIKNPDYSLIRYNGTGYALLGLSPAEVAGKTCYSLMGHDKPCENCTTTQALKSRKLESGERYVPQFNRWLLCRSNPILDDQGHVVHIVEQLHDITERRQTEEKLRQLEKAEGLTRMAGAVAHHYNNLLAAVMGNLEMAVMPQSEGTFEAEYVTEALRAARRAAELGKLMLAYLGQTTVKRTPQNFSEICREYLTDLKADLPPNIHLDTRLHGPDLMLSGNREQLRQVLNNLLTNAIEALGHTSGTIALRLDTVDAEQIPALRRFPVVFEPGADRYACLEVSDTGSGIAPDDLDKLFDPFFSTRFTGRGLGLPVVLGTLKTHQGCISVENGPEKGTIFRVYLPLTVDLEAPFQRIPPATLQPLAGITVLVVDDEDAVRKMVTQMLTMQGMTVIQARNGPEALELFGQHRDSIRVVLSDLTMPGMNGWQLLKALRQKRPHLPVILSSGYDYAHVMDGAQNELPQAFLGKPYRRADLNSALEKALRLPAGG